MLKTDIWQPCLDSATSVMLYNMINAEIQNDQSWFKKKYQYLQKVVVILTFKINVCWYTYSQNPRVMGMATWISILCSEILLCDSIRLIGV
jgi:hypothetical protein